MFTRYKRYTRDMLIDAAEAYGMHVTRPTGSRFPCIVTRKRPSASVMISETSIIRYDVDLTVATNMTPREAAKYLGLKV